MNKFVTLILSLFAVFFFASCKEYDEENDENANKQTILVYMPWSGSATSLGLYEFFTDNLDSIESGIKTQKGLKNSRVLVFLSKSAHESELYEIICQENNCRHKTLKTYDNSLDYTSSEGITELLREVVSQAPAWNYAMIIGCHGTGWTFKDSWKDYPNNAKHYPFFGKRRNNRPVTRFFGSVNDMENFATDIPSLAKGITDARIKMQYILFDDCYMANVETAYELKDATNILLGSTSEIMAIGLPYQTIFSSLNGLTPDYNEATRKFNEFYSQYVVPCGTLTAINCRQIDELANTMKLINSRYHLEDSDRSEIQILDGFHTPIFYDLGDYVNKIVPEGPLLDKFKAAMKNVVRATSSTPKIFSYLYGVPNYIELKTFSGITISDPSVNSVVIESKKRTSWWKATHGN